MGAQVVISGRSLENDAPSLISNGSYLIGTYTVSNGGIHPGDFVAVVSCTTGAANAIWPVVNATTTYFILQTNIPNIVVGSGVPLFEFRGNECKNLNLIHDMNSSIGNGSYRFNFTDTQPDYYFVTTSGKFVSNTNSGVVVIDNVSTTYAIGICQDITNGAGLFIPNNYFTLKLEGIQ